MIAALVELPRSFRRYFSLFRSYSGRHLYALLLLILVGSYAEGLGIALFFPLLRGGGADDALSRALGDVLTWLHVPAGPLAVLPFIVGVFLVKGALLGGMLAYQGYLAAQVPLRIRRDLIAALRGADYRAAVEADTGFQTNLLVNEVGKVSSGFILFTRVFPPAVNMVVFFGIVLWLDWRLTMLCSVMGLCAVAVLGFTGRIALAASNNATRENASISSSLIQVVQAFKYLRATAGFDRFSRRIDTSISRLAEAESRSTSAAALSAAVAQPMIVLLLASVIFYRVALKQEALGSLFVLLVYLYRIMTDLWTFQVTWQGFITYIPPIELVSQTLSRLRGAVESTGSRPYQGTAVELSVEGVSFAYDVGRPVLRDVSLRIPSNTTMAFVGASGSGKSTLVDLLMGTLKPDAGRILVDGTPMDELDLETLRRRVGYVPQDALLFDDTVANNIALWGAYDEARVRDAARRALCAEFIDAMPAGYASTVGERGIKLSGGQRQRLAIARELYKNPSLLVLDEATSALDSESELAIQRTIEALRGETTILVIAHRLSTIRNCEHICVLHEGAIVEQGSYGSLLNQEGSRFQRLCQIQQITEERA